MNGLVFACGDVRFINKDENIIKVPNFGNKIGELVAMENIVPKLKRESLFSLLSPFSRRMSSNNENMRRRKSEGRILHKVKDNGNHRPSFAGLSRCDGENRMNGAVDEAFSDTFAE